MSENHLEQNDKWIQFRRRYEESWQKAKTQESMYGEDLPVDHFFPTQLAVIKGKLDLGLAGLMNEDLIFSKHEAKNAVLEILKFLVQQGIDKEQKRRVTEIWYIDPGEVGGMGGQGLANMLGEEGNPWDPFEDNDDFQD